MEREGGWEGEGSYESHPLYLFPPDRDAYSTILGHLVSSMARLSDLTAEEVHCVCALLCVLEGGLHVAAIKAEDVVIEDSKGTRVNSSLQE